MLICFKNQNYSLAKIDKLYIIKIWNLVKLDKHNENFWYDKMTKSSLQLRKWKLLNRRTFIPD